jgi:WD40 repeat protein
MSNFDKCSILTIAGSSLCFGVLPFALHANDDSPEQRLPERCRSYLKTERTRLIDVWGTHEPSGIIERCVFSTDRRLALLAVSTSASPSITNDAEEGPEIALELWDMTKLKKVRSFAVGKGEITAIAISPDGSRAVSSIGNTGVRLWNLATGTEEKRIKSDESNCSPLVFLPKGTLVIIGHADYAGELWELESGKVRSLPGADEKLGTFVACPPDDENVIIGWPDGKVKLSSLVSGKNISSFQTGSMVCAALSSDGKIMAVGSENGVIQIWNLASPKQLQLCKGHQGNVWSVDFSPDGKRLVSCSEDSTIRLWDIATGKETRKIDPVSATRVVFSGDGKRLFGLSPSGFATLDIGTGEEIEIVASHVAGVSNVAYSPDGSQVVSRAANNTVRVWNPINGRPAIRCNGEFSTGAALSADGNLAIVGGTDHKLYIWDLAVGKQTREFGGHEEGVLAVAISPDAKYALSAGLDHSVRLWDAASGKELRQLEGHNGLVTCVTFSPDGRTLLTGGEDRTIRIWSRDNPSESRVLKGHKREVTSVTFSTDGKHILSGSKDRTLRLWDATTGEQVRAFGGHQNWVTDVALSPDGERALSTSDDATIKLWDVATGRELDEIDLSASPDVPSCVAFAPDGKAFVVGTASWVILQFKVAP